MTFKSATSEAAAAAAAAILAEAEAWQGIMALDGDKTLDVYLDVKSPHAYLAVRPSLEVARDYRVGELPQILADAADVFLTQRHRPATPKFIDRPVEYEDVMDLLFGNPDCLLKSPWDDEHREVLTGLSSIIAIQETGLLATNANGTHFRLRVVHDDGWGEPTTDIPYSLWEGMAAAVFDTVAAVQRRVRAENTPATLGMFRQ